MLLSNDGLSCYVDNATFGKVEGNLVKNGNFETQETGRYVAMAGWDCGTNIREYTHLDYEPGRNYVAHIAGEKEVGRVITSAAMAVTPRATYTLAVDFKGKVTTEWLQVYLRFYDENGRQLNALETYRYEEFRSDSGTLTEQWQTSVLTLTAPDGAASMKVLFSLAGQYEKADANTPSVPLDVYDVTLDNVIVNMTSPA